MNEKKNKIFTALNYSFFSAIIICCIVLSIIYKLNWLTLVSCISGILYIVFLSDRNVLNFIVGFISSTTYIFVAFKAKLYGEVIFYLIIDLPMIIISFVMWKKHLEDDLRVESRKLSVKQIIIISICSLAAVAVYAFILKLIGGVNVIVDAISTVVSFIATILMAQRYREQWVMWLVVYIVSIVMWATTFDLLMLIMSICCFISCFIGFVNWTISVKNKTHQPAESKTESIQES